MWSVWLLFWWSVFTVGDRTAGIRDPGSKPDSPGSLRLPDLLQRSQSRVQSPQSLGPLGTSPGSGPGPGPGPDPGLEVLRSRRRRSVFLHTGVRICPQESLSEVLSSHRAYYQLRVCQEAVWEAFRIFLDRIPGTSEYQTWVQTCQSESLCISDIALNFSSSEEHLSMVHRRMSRVRDRRPPARGAVTVAPAHRGAVTVAPAHRGAVTVAPAHRPAHGSGPEAPPTVTTSSLIVTETPTSSFSPDITETTSQSELALDSRPDVLQAPEAPEAPEVPDQSTVDLNLVPEAPEALDQSTVDLNLVPEAPEALDQRTVDLIVDLKDPGYRELLEERDSLQFDDLAQHLQDQMQHAFVKLPGFKALSVLGISPVDAGISVHYSLLFEGPPGAPLQSSDLDLRDLIRAALRDEASLPIDLLSLHFSPAERVSTATASSTLHQPSEPDSHNEFEVLPEDLDPEKPRVPVPLTPMEKENALVTLLDPTAVSELETTSTGAWRDNRQTQSSGAESEERVLIITHQVESVTESGGTGQLLRSNTTATPSSFVTISPNVVPAKEEDSSPDIIKVTPTIKQTFATPETKEENTVFETTTLSEITGQPPTQTVLDERENAIPDEVKVSDLSKSEETKLEFGEILGETEIVQPDLDEESTGEGTKDDILVETPTESEHLEQELVGIGEDLVEVTKPKDVISETESLVTDSETSEESTESKTEDLTNIETEIERGDGAVIVREEDSEELPEIKLQEEILRPEINVLGEILTPTEKSQEIFDGTEKEIEQEAKGEVEILTKPQEEVVVVHPKQETNDVSETKQEPESAVEDEVVVQKPEVEIVVRPKQEVDEIIKPEEESAVSEPEMDHQEVEEITKDATKTEEMEDIVVVLPTPEETVVQTESPKFKDVSEPKVEPEFTTDDMFVVPPTSGEVGIVVQKEETEASDVSVAVEDEVGEGVQTESPKVPEITEVVAVLPPEEEDVETVVQEPKEDMFVVHPTPENAVQTEQDEKELVVLLPPEEEEPKYEEDIFVVHPTPEIVVQTEQEDKELVVVLPPEEEEPKYEEEVVVVQKSEEEVVVQTAAEDMFVVQPTPGIVVQTEPEEKQEEPVPQEPKEDIFVVSPTPEIEVHLPPEVEEPEYEEDIKLEVTTVLPTKEVEEKSRTEPPSESIKVLRPLDGRGGNVFRGGAGEVLEESEFGAGEEEKNVVMIPAEEEREEEEREREEEVQEEEVKQTEGPSESQMETTAAPESEIVPSSSAEPEENRPSSETLPPRPQEEHLIPPEESVASSSSAPPGGAVEVIDEDLAPGETEERDVIGQSLEVSPGGGNVGQERGEEEEEEEVQDLAVELEKVKTTAEQEENEGSALEVDRLWDSVTPPPLSYLTTPTMTSSQSAPELVVFFSMRVTNLHFSEDLFNKTSEEYRALESSFRDMLLPYLQANLSGFRALEVLSFRRGSVVVNSKMRFTRWVPYNVTAAVQNVLDEFCVSAARRRSIDIDRRSLDVEPADRADPCKFLACPESSICEVEPGTREPHCRYKRRVQVPVWS